MTVNSRGFELNTDYEMDKILDYASGSLSVATIDSEQQTVAHGLTYNPLVVVSWSTDPDFNVSYDSFATSGNYPNTTIFDAGADATNFTVFAVNNTASTATFYWRIYTLPRHDADPDIVATASTSQNTFAFNTDRRYTKLYEAGMVTETTTINHGLGYRPQVMLWATNAGVTYPIVAGFVYQTPAGGESTAEVTTEDLIIGMGPDCEEVHYRIYLDD